MRIGKICLVLACVLALASGAHVLWAQTTTATLEGVVKDTTGAILPGATIRVKSIETGISRTLLTDDAGRYRIPGLAPGNYEIQAELTGFQTALIKSINLVVGQHATVDVVLKVGELTEVVEVVGAVPLVETATSSLYGLVDEKKIVDLPLNGRSFDQLAVLQPGAMYVPVATQGAVFGGRGRKMSVGGARPNQNLFLMDGTDINDFFNSTPGSIGGQLLGVETVKEFTVLTDNYTAEFGRTAGGVVNAVTKSGTNDFHGSAFEFHRNSALDAKNFFDSPDEPIPPFKRNQFGFTIGGPIKKDRTFFFGAYEGFRERLGRTLIATVPTAEARRGNIPGQSPIAVDPAVVPYLNLYPLPNGRIFPNGTGEFIFFRTEPTNEDFFQIRIDHKISGSDTFFARYTFDDANDEKAFPSPIAIERDSSRNQYLTLEEKKIFSPQWLNIFRFGFNRSRMAAANDFAPGVSIPSGLEFIPGRPLGMISVGGMTTLGGNTIFPIQYLQNLFEFSDDVNYSKGRHSLKLGFNFKRFQYNTLQDFFREGQFIFNNLRDFLQARAFLFAGASLRSDPIRAIRLSLIGAYLQDDFKLSPRLTLNLGLRFESYTTPTEANGKMVNLRDPLRDRATTAGEPYFINPARANFAPRLGLVWDPSGSGKTSIRAGFGIFHDYLMGPYFATPIHLQPPLYEIVEMLGPVFPKPFSVPSAIRPLHAQPMEFEPGNTYVMHYNLSIQREIGGATAVTVAYSGSRGINLQRANNPNVALGEIRDGRKFFGNTTPRDRINQAFGVLRMKHTGGNSVYNSLRLGLNRRFADGLQFQVSYTFSRSIDDSTQINGNDYRNTNQEGQDPFCRKCERGLSAFHIKHAFSANYTYDLPFGPRRRFGGNLGGLAGALAGGWQINGIITINDGFPFSLNLTHSQSNNQSFDRNDRPNLKPGASNNPVLGGPDRYYDPNAFELAPFGFYGNLGRNTLIGPGLATFDFSLVKSNSIGEGKSLQFRAEFFNLFNRPNFDVPFRFIFSSVNQKVPNPNAGRITATTTTSRQVQFGLKFIF